MDSYLTDQITSGLYFTLRTAKVEKPRECSLSYELVLKGDQAIMTKLPQANRTYVEERIRSLEMIIRPKSEETPCSMNAWGDSSQQF